MEKKMLCLVEGVVPYDKASCLASLRRAGRAKRVHAKCDNWQNSLATLSCKANFPKNCVCNSRLDEELNSDILLAEMIG